MAFLLRTSNTFKYRRLILQPHKPILPATLNRQFTSTNSINSPNKSIHKSRPKLSTALKIKPVTNKEAYAKIHKYRTATPRSLTVANLLEFAVDTGSEIKSIGFLKKELPIRLANMIYEIESLPDSFKETPSMEVTLKWYWQSFKDLLPYEGLDINDNQVKEEFTASIQKIIIRHSNVVETMAHAVLEYRQTVDRQAPDMDRILSSFLDRFFMSRIGIRLLMNQHISLFSSKLNSRDYGALLGSFDKNMNIRDVVQQAYDDAQMLCERHYADFDCPELKIEVLNSTEIYGETAFEIGYVSSHLHHICFEVFKNAQRATIEHSCRINKNSKFCNLNTPAITVSICIGPTEISIKISDLGGGASCDVTRNWFGYMYSTAPKPTNASPGLGGQNVPMAGYGVGLPISRLYARYLSGDLQVHSIEGYGTDAVIYLQRDSKSAKEVLPNYIDSVGKMYKVTAEHHAKKEGDTWIGGTRMN